MSSLLRNLKSLPGAILSFTVLMVIALWVWNFLSAHNVPGASWVSAHLSSGGSAVPVTASVLPVQTNSYH